MNFVQNFLRSWKFNKKSHVADVSSAKQLPRYFLGVTSLAHVSWKSIFSHCPQKETSRNRGVCETSLFSYTKNAKIWFYNFESSGPKVVMDTIVQICIYIYIQHPCNHSSNTANEPYLRLNCLSYFTSCYKMTWPETQKKVLLELDFLVCSSSTEQHQPRPKFPWHSLAGVGQQAEEAKLAPCSIGTRFCLKAQN